MAVINPHRVTQHKMWTIVDAACIVRRQGLCNGRVSVRPSVRHIIRPQQRRATGLLLSAVRAGDNDRQRRASSSNGAAARRSAANADSALLTAELTRLNTDLLMMILLVWQPIGWISYKQSTV